MEKGLIEDERIKCKICGLGVHAHKYQRHVMIVLSE